MNNKELFKEAARLDNIIWEIYKPGDTGNIPEDHRSIMYLKADIETIMLNTKEETWQHNIFDKIEESAIYTMLLPELNLPRIRKAVEIRSDWASALRSVKNGRALAGPIEWSFSKRDIKELARLHKNNKFRRKIEDLLEDCNFHTECGDFASEHYEKYIKEE